MQKMRLKFCLAVSVCAFALAACGGGGGDTGSSAANDQGTHAAASGKANSAYIGQWHGPCAMAAPKLAKLPAKPHAYSTVRLRISAATSNTLSAEYTQDFFNNPQCTGAATGSFSVRRSVGFNGLKSVPLHGVQVHADKVKFLTQDRRLTVGAVTLAPPVVSATSGLQVGGLYWEPQDLGDFQDDAADQGLLYIKGGTQLFVQESTQGAVDAQGYPLALDPEPDFLRLPG